MTYIVSSGTLNPTILYYTWRIKYKRTVLVYNCLHGLTSSYVADELHHPVESEFRRRLRSASFHEPSVPRTRLSTYGNRAFPLATVRIWNSLPQHITLSPSLPVFCSCSKTYFFELCYLSLLLSCPQSDTVIYAHVNRFYLLTY